MTGVASNIRLARPAEAAVVTSLAFRPKASNGYDAAFMAACRAELVFDAETFAHGETWIAEDEGGRLLGFFDLRLELDMAEAAALFVEPDCQGLGRRPRALGQAGGAGGGPECQRDRHRPDPAAVPFYLRMGLEPAGEAPSGSIPGRKLPRLVKLLPPPK